MKPAPVHAARPRAGGQAAGQSVVAPPEVIVDQQRAEDDAPALAISDDSTGADAGHWTNGSAGRERALITYAGYIGWTTPADGLVDDMPMWRLYTGQARDTVRDWGWLDAVHPDDRERVARAWRDAASGAAPYEVEFRVRRRDGVYRAFLDRGVPVVDDDGQVREWVGFLTDITERKQSEEERSAVLISEREAARASEGALLAANGRMNEFLGIASHELKTPLTTILANTQYLARRLNDSRTRTSDPEALEAALETVRTVIDRTARQTARLTRLVNDLVDVSRIQAGKLELRLAPCDLAPLVTEMVDEQRQLHPERRIALDLAAEPPVCVVGDADRLGQVLANYLSNALKYSAEDQPVTVRLARDGDRARVSVRDAGPGVPAGEESRIWERFYRSAAVTVRSGSGIGLGMGLHIARTIVECHGGEVGLRTRRGKGTTFWYTLPLADPVESVATLTCQPAGRRPARP